MNAKKIFGLCVISALAASLSVAQQTENPSKNIFFKGDSLNGFNTTQCYQQALAKNLNPTETSNYFYFQEKYFVDQKYHITVTPEPIVTSNFAVITSACNNVDFENGDFGGWTGAIGYNANSNAALTVTSATINTLGINSPEASCSYQTIVTAASGNDPYGGFPMLDAGGGTYAVRIGGQDINRYYGSNGTYNCAAGGPGAESGGEMLEQTFTVSASNTLFTYKYAVVLDDGGHADGEQPFFRTEVFDQFGNPIPCLQYYVQASNGVPPVGFFNSSTPNVYYLPWTSNSLNLGAYVGQTVTVRFTAAGCIYGGHFGYAYIDCSCGAVAINSSPTTCLGGTMTLGAPSGGLNYQWAQIPTGTGIVGSSTGQTCNVTQNGQYQVTVTTGSGCSYVLDTTITFAPMPTVTIVTNNISCNGENNGKATAVPTGAGPFTYSWSTNPSQTTPTATNLGLGTYTVSVTSTTGCTSSASAVITQPSVLKMQAGGFSATCFGTCNGYAVVIPSGGTAPYTYSWTPSGNTTANANNLCAGNYCIKLTDANGCNVDTCVTVSQPTILALNTTTTTANCSQANGSTSVNATGGTGTYTYLWAPSGQTTATATAITAGTYTVTVTDGNSCTQTATAVVPNAPGVVASIASSTNDGCFGTCDGTATSLATSGTAPYNYSWNAVPAQTTAEATGLCAGTYTVSITDATGCSNTASVTITQPTQITVSPSAATTICIGQSTILSANAAGGTPAYTYSWNNIYNGQDYTVSPTTTPTTYTVVVTDADGCISAPQTVVVNLNPPLAVIAKNDTSLCLGGHASLSAMGSGGNGTYNYAWQPGALSGSPISVTPNTTTIYTVTVTDNCGTPPATNTVTVTVNPLPVVSFSADTVSGCYPLCVTFTNLSTPASASATWEFGDGNTANTIATASNCYQIPNSYNVTLTVTDNLGCSNSTTLNDMITVYPHPTANFSMSPQPATIMNPTVFFKDLSTGTVNQWEWNLGDVPNSSSNLQNPQYTYPDTGYYNVQLIVTNNFGCTDSITKTVYIEGQFVIYVPNAFTPNGDGINDTFYPKGTGIDPNNYQMYIFDRWGNMLFYTTSLNQGWNGKVEGDSQLVQEDVYVWKIICKDFLGNWHLYMGHVTILK